MKTKKNTLRSIAGFVICIGLIAFFSACIVYCVLALPSIGAVSFSWKMIAVFSAIPAVGLIGAFVLWLLSLSGGGARGSLSDERISDLARAAAEPLPHDRLIPSKDTKICRMKKWKAIGCTTLFGGLVAGAWIKAKRIGRPKKKTILRIRKK